MELLVFIVFQLLMEVQSDNSLQKPTISVSKYDDLLMVACEIPLSVRADVNCSLYTEDGDLRYQGDSQWSQSGGNFCMFRLSHSELFTRSVNSRQLICVYSLKTEPEIRSPHSDTYTIRGSTSNTTEQTTTTAMKTSLPSKTNLPISTPKETIMLVFIGVAVILAGLMGLICLCHFTRLKHPESHQDNKTDPTDTRSVITSINPIYQPSDVNDVNKQQKQGNTEENENVYHLYCTIPDKPVHSNTEDHVYSLLKMH
ncbi:uncharacterized protein LOC127160358 isoform X3 [Labeo rohita]|uniref:uncharacterized protein LOC127160358 isoform X3 n=1 Tax=Labeo rohita TaxID=84645 RepID=UPI0021E2E84F|nr:uncharacterized protein LOC127160358 isoform X3 [Labeo rohita]XP_050958963.1 uncharacterized protein LOC127160358 isoform X3 [Labeo rohita]